MSAHGESEARNELAGALKSPRIGPESLLNWGALPSCYLMGKPKPS
jgi:hypothetical protein